MDFPNTIMSKTMAEMNCVSFRIRFDFDEKVFDVKKFRKMANLDPKLPVNVSVVANSEIAERDEHLHISLDIDGAGSSLTLSFHTGAVEFENPEDARKYSIEKRIQELATVFKVQKMSGVTISRFVFPEEFSPLLFLGYPISGLGGGMGNATVSGQQLTFGKGSSVKKVFLTIDEVISSVIINATRSVTLSAFRPEAFISKDAVIANALVKESDYVD